ncbi:LAQU0S02e02696g1_1 [Lachancea quebecensis]|uniref:Nucleolar protein SWM2 n=1 Tax=Lachancea quebecensis TaxID=1654605 RepID=A0A0N7ML10_9SACH|nr:LAQU0S02e02696g1_1 [Lachancea quebecensis]
MLCLLMANSRNGFMNAIPRDLLRQFLDSFTDITVVPVRLTPALFGYYNAIAKDPEYSQLALEKCNYVLANLNEHSPEIVTRCSRLREVLMAAKERDATGNLIVEHINLEDVSDMPFLSRDQHMANLIIEEIDVADYIEEPPSQ